MTFTLTKVSEANKLRNYPIEILVQGLNIIRKVYPYIDFADNRVCYKDFTFPRFSQPLDDLACSPVSYGRYKIIDPTRVCFYITQMSQAGIGDCNHVLDQDAKDLGAFSVEQLGQSLRLIRVLTKS